MSELSDEIGRAFQAGFKEHHSEEMTELSGLIEIDASDYLKNIKCFDEFRMHYGQEIAKVVRRVMRRHAGATNWVSADEAMNAVKGEFMDKFLPMTFNVLADGIQMGRKPTPVMKKYFMFDKELELFSNGSFRADSALEAVRMRSDADLNDGLYRFLIGAVYTTGSAAGYRLASRSEEGAPSPGKIYELWALTMHSVMITAYQAGYHLGKKWEEKETLDGILSATESGEK